MCPNWPASFNSTRQYRALDSVAHRISVLSVSKTVLQANLQVTSTVEHTSLSKSTCDGHKYLLLMRAFYVNACREYISASAQEAVCKLRTWLELRDIAIASVSAFLTYCLDCRDDVQHTGRRINWGTWAVCQDDWAFGGTGNPKQGASYDPAPGERRDLRNMCTVIPDEVLSCLWLKGFQAIFMQPIDLEMQQAFLETAARQ